MEFNQRLQELRKQRGLTQEELAEALYVSRTAVSKWESGRGYPNIDSLKAIAKFFSVTIDELLSSGEALTIAEEDSRKKVGHLHVLIFGLLDCSAALLFFLPFFGQKEGGAVEAVSLFTLGGIALYLRAAYWAIVMGMLLWGILMLALQNCQQPRWERSRRIVSLALNAAGTSLFIISQQPYAATFLFAFLIIKALLLFKRQ